MELMSNGIRREGKTESGDGFQLLHVNINEERERKRSRTYNVLKDT